jgi:hypothetical protein
MIDNRHLYMDSPISQWYQNHRVVFMHHDQMIYVTSLIARLRWRVPFWSAK